MGRYYADKIYNEEIDGVMCNVKLLKTYSKEELYTWLCILHDEHYIVRWHNQYTITFNSFYDDTDVVILNSAIKIKHLWIKEIFGNDSGYNVV